MDLVEHRFAVLYAVSAAALLAGICLGIAYDSWIGGLLLWWGVAMLAMVSVSYVIARRSGKLDWYSGKYLGEFKSEVGARVKFLCFG